MRPKNQLKAVKEAKSKEFKPCWEIDSCSTAPLKKLTDQQPSSSTISPDLKPMNRPSEGTSLAKLHWHMARDTSTWRHCCPHRLAQSNVPTEITAPAASTVADNALPARGDPTACSAEDKDAPKQNTSAQRQRPGRRPRHPEKRPSRRLRHWEKTWKETDVPKTKTQQKTKVPDKDWHNTKVTLTLQLAQHFEIYIISVQMPGHWYSCCVVKWPTEWQMNTTNNYLAMQEDRPGAAWSHVG